jgi:subtilisin family serine protease
MARSLAFARAVGSLVTLLAIAAGPAHAQARPEPHGVFPARVTNATAVDLKLDAALRVAVERYAEAPATAKAGGSAVTDAATLLPPALPYGLLSAGPGREPLAAVFVKLDRPGSVDALIAAGATVLLQEQELVLARIPFSRVTEAALSPGVRSMVLSKRWAADLDSSRIRTRVKDVQAGAGTLAQPYLGDGVIVGVLDSGLDYTHDDFRSSTTDSRLLALFDYSQGTDGAECRPGQLDSLTCGEIDGAGSHGHGTHVTGIAAGNGRLKSQYTGMAPHADLLFVKGIRDAQSNGGFTDADIVNGCAWMLNKALALGKPIAINLSLGGQLGAHDGTSLQEQFLDRFSGPGRIIVAAAGNSGGDTIHVAYATQGNNYQTGVESPIVLGATSAVVDLWAPAGNSIKVGVAAYNKSDVINPIYVSNAAAPGQLVQVVASAGGPALGNVTIDARTTSDPNNGDMNVFIQIEPAVGGIDPSTLFWSVYTYGSGSFDMWLATPGIFFPFRPFFPSYFRPGDDDKTVAIPATAKRVLCIGSHVSKTQWIDIDNVVRIESGAVLDAISVFSSHGPSRDGRTLPNLTAPGEAIISALSKDYPADRPHIVQGGGYQEQQGTSQAAPHITGIAALMLERDPALTPENIRTILQQTATPVGNPNIHGAGRVQALAALEATPDPLNCTVVLPSGRTVPCEELAQEPVSLMAYPNPASEGIRFSFTSPTRAYVDLAVYDLMGRRLKALRSEDMTPGVYSATWNGDDEHGRRVPGGIYFARLTLPGGTRTIRLMVRR